MGRDRSAPTATGPRSRVGSVARFLRPSLLAPQDSTPDARQQLPQNQGELPPNAARARCPGASKEGRRNRPVGPWPAQQGARLPAFAATLRPDLDSSGHSNQRRWQGARRGRGRRAARATIRNEVPPLRAGRGRPFSPRPTTRPARPTAEPRGADRCRRRRRTPGSSTTSTRTSTTRSTGANPGRCRPRSAALGSSPTSTTRTTRPTTRPAARGCRPQSTNRAVAPDRARRRPGRRGRRRPPGSSPTSSTSPTAGFGYDVNDWQPRAATPLPGLSVHPRTDRPSERRTGPRGPG